MKAKDYVNEIAKQVTSLMQEHGTDWAQPWIGKSYGMPYNPARKARYTGSNVIGLMLYGYHAGFSSNEWATYKQWQSIGRQVTVGEKAKGRSNFYSTFEGKDGGDDYLVMRVSNVFNIEQTDNYEAPVIENDDKVNEIEAVETFLSNIPSSIKVGGNSAYFSITDDYIQMPPRNTFIDTKDATATQNYYSTLMHEHGHWTGHKSRLDRLPKNFDRQSLAFEELVAELTSVLLSCHLGIEKRPTANHAKYLNNWVEAIKDNPRVIMKAMTAAEKAMTYLTDYQEQQVAAE